MMRVSLRFFVIGRKGFVGGGWRGEPVWHGEQHRACNALHILSVHIGAHWQTEYLVRHFNCDRKMLEAAKLCVSRLQRDGEWIMNGGWNVLRLECCLYRAALSNPDRVLRKSAR